MTHFDTVRYRYLPACCATTPSCRCSYLQQITADVRCVGGHACQRGVYIRGLTEKSLRVAELLVSLRVRRNPRGRSRLADTAVVRLWCILECCAARGIVVRHRTRLLRRAFQKFANPSNGVIAISYRQVPLSHTSASLRCQCRKGIDMRLGCQPS